MARLSRKSGSVACDGVSRFQLQEPASHDGGGGVVGVGVGGGGCREVGGGVDGGRAGGCGVLGGGTLHSQYPAVLLTSAQLTIFSRQSADGLLHTVGQEALRMSIPLREQDLLLISETV